MNIKKGKIAESIFLSPLTLWNCLVTRKTLELKDHPSGEKKYRIILCKKTIDVNGRSYNRSIQGLELALMEAIENLISINYYRWLASEKYDLKFTTIYVNLVRKHIKILFDIFKKYYSENHFNIMIVCFLCFQKEEAELLASYKE